MKYRLATLILCLEAMAALPSYAETNVPPTTAVTVIPEEPRPVLAVPQGYHYDARGRRDPFINPVPKAPPPAPVAAEVKPDRPPGLKGAIASEVILMGILVAKTDPSMTRAILRVPGMKAPVIVMRGESLYDAVIREIRPDAVIFTRKASAKDSSDSPENRELVKRVSTAGDKK